MKNLKNTNAVILRKPTNPNKSDSVYVLAIQEASTNAATRSQTPKNRIAAHKLVNSNKVNKPQPKGLWHMAKNTAWRVQEVIDRQTQGQEVTIKSIKIDSKDKAMEDSTNTVTSGLFHKPKDMNAPPTNPPKTSTSNLPITPLMGSTNLKRMQRGWIRWTMTKTQEKTLTMLIKRDWNRVVAQMSSKRPLSLRKLEVCQKAKWTRIQCTKAPKRPYQSTWRKGKTGLRWPNC